VPDHSRRRTVIPEADLAAISHFCDEFTPPEHRDQMRVECSVRGKSVTVFECRPPWGPEFGPDWIRTPIAQLRFEPDAGHWHLHFSDSNDRWHVYELVDPTPEVARLLREIDDDPTCIFWG